MAEDEKGPILYSLLSKLGPSLAGRIMQWWTQAPVKIQDPKIDPYIDQEGEPFSYFAKPVMQLGVRNGRIATELTPEGHLYTGAAEIIFFGNGKQLEKRIWTLKDGYIPLVSTKIQRDDIEYNIEIFHYWMDPQYQNPKSLINMVQITAINHGVPQEVALGVGFCYKQKKDHRVAELKQEKFQKGWKYDFADSCAIRDHKIIYCCDGPTTQKTFGDKSAKVKEDTVVCISEKKYFLRTGEKAVFIIKIPHYPIPQNTALAKKIREIKWEDLYPMFIREWRSYFDETMWVEIPEKKVADTFHSSRVFAIMCQDVMGDMIEQHVNRFQYNKFWIRDSSFFTRFYLFTGHFDFAKGLLLRLLKTQKKNGNFISQAGQYDGWGQVLWSFGEYLRFTGDTDFARRHFYQIPKAIEWFVNATSRDPMGLMPATTAFDNEMILGHYTDHNFWAICGLNAAIYISSILGKNEEAKEYSDIKKRFYINFVRHLRKVAEKVGGYIPPGLDCTNGFDWGNLSAVYPEKCLDPSDPLVRRTADYAWSKFNEGIMTYGISLHHYLTERVAQTFLILGDVKRALETFYGILLHTGSCNEAFEWCIRPWGNRDYLFKISGKVVFGNYPPHGWSGVLYSSLLRNMLLREESNSIILLSGLSPAWIKAGSKIEVKNAQTTFGKMNLSLEFIDNKQFSLKMCPVWKEKPVELQFPLPWYLELINASGNGVINTEKNTLAIAPDATGEITIKVQWKTLPKLSYDEYVRQYIRKWRRIQLEYYR
ncbi:MAG: hypothetical protein QXL15_04090 [Candidatus Korarchaeota archaeon]